MKTNNLSIAISLTCFKRADYLKEVLDSLKASVDHTGYQDFIFYPSIDYYNDQIYNLVSEIDWIEKKIVCNKPPLGCNKNTQQAIFRAIENHDAVIHLEDDTVLAKDALGFYVYAIEKYANNDQVISVSGYNKTDEPDNNKYYDTFTEQFFCCWGCCFWKNKFSTISNNWTNQLNFMNPQSWDSYLQENVFRNKYYQVRPVISRVQNIGAKNGTYVHDPVWHYYNHRSPYTSNDLKHKQYNSWKEYAEDN